MKLAKYVHNEKKNRTFQTKNSKYYDRPFFGLGVL